MRIELSLDLFHGEEDWRRSARAVELILLAMVEVARDYIRSHPTLPRLYESGMKYIPESESSPVEKFLDIPHILDAGGGDCDDLVPWLCAERIERDHIEANPFVHWRRGTDGTLRFHVVCKLANGSIEDPSRRLGM